MFSEFLLKALNLRLIAKNYSYHNLPRGWMLVNDGYGCGYTSRDMLQALDIQLLVVVASFLILNDLLFYIRLVNLTVGGIMLRQHLQALRMERFCFRVFSSILVKCMDAHNSLSYLDVV